MTLSHLIPEIGKIRLCGDAEERTADGASERAREGERERGRERENERAREREQKGTDSSGRLENMRWLSAAIDPELKSMLGALNRTVEDSLLI